MMRKSLTTTVTAAVAMLSVAATAHAADVRVLVTGAARAAFTELAPQFEHATGHKLIAQYGLPPELIRKIDAGEPFDVIILSYDVAALIKQGKLAADSRTVLGQSGVGVGRSAAARGSRISARLNRSSALCSTPKRSEHRAKARADATFLPCSTASVSPIR